MLSEIGNDLVTTYGEACKAFAWFGPLSLRDMVRAENALVGFIAALETENARLTAELSALRAEKAELDSGMHEMGAKITALVKAGDAMADKLNSFGTDAYVAEWGKEG